MAQRRARTTRLKNDPETSRKKPVSDASNGTKTLLEWDQIEDWQRDNEHILTGYRPASFSYLGSLRTVHSIHNETMNIHSHLFGALLFFSLPYATYKWIAAEGLITFSQWPDIVVFATFFLGVAICFLLSSTFHIFANHSRRINILGNQLDYLGIVILMWGSTIPSVYYGFYCDAHLQRRYWTIVSVLATACIITTFNKGFRHPTLRPYRALMYFGLGFSALGFVTHGILLYSWDIQKQRMSLDWMAVMAALNITGAVAYAGRIPERLRPRKFDILGNSHQIMHLLVIFAALAHFKGLGRAFGHVHGEAFVCDGEMMDPSSGR